MKKLLTIMLALVMVLSLSVTALAADITQDSDPKTGNTTVTFNVDPTYTVTIPATVELEKKTAADETVTYEKDLTVSAENVRLLEGKQIQVTLTSDFTLTNDTQNGGAATNLSYTVTIGDSATPHRNGWRCCHFRNQHHGADQRSALRGSQPHLRG